MIRHKLVHFDQGRRTGIREREGASNGRPLATVEMASSSRRISSRFPSERFRMADATNKRDPITAILGAMVASEQPIRIRVQLLDTEVRPVGADMGDPQDRESASSCPDPCPPAGSSVPHKRRRTPPRRTPRRTRQRSRAREPGRKPWTTRARLRRLGRRARRSGLHHDAARSNEHVKSAVGFADLCVSNDAACDRDRRTRSMRWPCQRGEVEDALVPAHPGNAEIPVTTGEGGRGRRGRRLWAGVAMGRQRSACGGSVYSRRPGNPYVM